MNFSGLQDAWDRARIVVLLVGTAFAAVIAHFFSSVTLSRLVTETQEQEL